MNRHGEPGWLWLQVKSGVALSRVTTKLSRSHFLWHCTFKLNIMIDLVLFMRSTSLNIMRYHLTRAQKFFSDFPSFSPCRGLKRRPSVERFQLHMGAAGSDQTQR